MKKKNFHDKTDKQTIDKKTKNKQSTYIIETFNNNKQKTHTVMLSYLSETDIVSKLAVKIIEPKQSTYNEDPIYFAMMEMPNIVHVDSNIFNKYEEKLKVSLFYDKTVQERKVCVVFMHGYGSNRIQALNILPLLPRQYSLCCFDFSAEGKSDGNVVTYGIKEKYDIRVVINYLRSVGYKKFVLWGRSMGATCTLLYTLKQKPKDVFLQILDSPFISFEEAAIELTRKKVNIPQTLLKLVLDAVRQNLVKKNSTFNPFEVNLNKKISTNVPCLFIYNEKDDVVDAENSYKIMRNFDGHYEKLIIQEQHNAMRKKKTLKVVVEMMKKYLIKAEKGEKGEKGEGERGVMNRSKNKGAVHLVSKTVEKKKSQQTSDGRNQQINHNLFTPQNEGRRRAKDISQSYNPQEFDHYGFWAEQNLDQIPKCPKKPTMRGRGAVVGHQQKRKKVQPNKRCDQFFDSNSSQILHRRRPKSSLKVFSAEMQSSLTRGSTTPINLKGSKVSRTSQSLQKFTNFRTSLSNDFYL